MHQKPVAAVSETAGFRFNKHHSSRSEPDPLTSFCLNWFLCWPFLIGFHLQPNPPITNPHR